MVKVCIFSLHLFLQYRGGPQLPIKHCVVDFGQAILSLVKPRKYVATWDVDLCLLYTHLCDSLLPGDIQLTFRKGPSSKATLFFLYIMLPPLHTRHIFPTSDLYMCAFHITKSSLFPPTMYNSGVMSRHSMPFLAHEFFGSSHYTPDL